MTKSKILYCFKEVINLPGHETIAAVNACLSRRIKDRRFSNAVDISFDISGCNSAISLEVDVYSKEDYNNTIFKLKQVEKAARGLRKAIQKHKKLILKKPKNN